MKRLHGLASLDRDPRMRTCFSYSPQSMVILMCGTACKDRQFRGTFFPMQILVPTDGRYYD